MSHQILSLAQAAEHVHVLPNGLKHAAQRGEIPAVERGGDWYFDHAELDEWAQRNLLAAGHKEQIRQLKSMRQREQREHRDGWRMKPLFRLAGMNLALPGKTKAGIVRDMADLANATGLVYDQEGLFRELMEREDIAATAVGEGAAFLHPRYHDPYIFAESFVAYGRALRPVFFGSQNGEPTRHFFLIAATDHEMHLSMLARLSVMAHATEFLQILDNVMTVDDALGVIGAAEEGLLRL